ncbi:hypothetical protein GCM10027419_32120 [Pandoraea terrae]
MTVQHNRGINPRRKVRSDDDGNHRRYAAAQPVAAVIKHRRNVSLIHSILLLIECPNSGEQPDDGRWHKASAADRFS